MTDLPAGQDNLNDQLAPLRAKIDALDGRLLELLNQRAEIVMKIGKIKNDRDSPIWMPDREAQVFNRVRERNRGPLSDECVVAIWRELMSGSISLERPMKVGYLGPAGSFSHLAATRKFGACVDYSTIADIPGVFEDVAKGNIDVGLVPIENTTGGGITDTLDSFLTSSVQVCGEVLIGIHHNLLVRPGEGGDVQRVCSKAEVLQQCRMWLTANLPHAEQIPMGSSSRAAQLAAEEPGTAAIGSSLAAEMYKLDIRNANIEDNSANVTRFFVIGRQAARPTGDDKTAIMFTTAHRPGTLAEVLDVIRDYGLNLTHIDKRPSMRENWEYFFFIDCLGHCEDEHVAKAIEAARSHCLHLTVLGSFPRAKNVL